MIQQWLPWIGLATIPGLLNLFVAFWDLDEKCRLLPFFRPLRVPGVYLWALTQFFLPAVIFWVISSLSSHPAIDASLLGRAVIFGVGFVSVLNAKIVIGSQEFDIKQRLYDPLISIAYDLIERSQSGKTEAFWTDVETTLSQSPNLTAGLLFLENHFILRERFKPQPEKHYEERLQQAAKMIDRPQQAKEVKNLLQDVHRNVLPEALERFLGEQNHIVIEYFPQQTVKVLVGRR